LLQNVTQVFIAAIKTVNDNQKLDFMVMAIEIRLGRVFSTFCHSTQKYPFEDFAAL
jgi:hypothetical protein